MWTKLLTYWVKKTRAAPNKSIKSCYHLQIRRSSSTAIQKCHGHWQPKSANTEGMIVVLSFLPPPAPGSPPRHGPDGLSMQDPSPSRPLSVLPMFVSVCGQSISTDYFLLSNFWKQYLMIFNFYFLGWIHNAFFFWRIFAMWRPQNQKKKKKTQC
jgi:hypothetical protein